MNIRALKYASPLIAYALALVAFTHTGIYCWLVLLYAWIFIPLMELFLPPNNKNMDAAEEELAKKDKLYDFLLYATVIFLYPVLFIFLHSMQQHGLRTMDMIGRIATMGLLCGTFGINVGHELGHRVNRYEQLLAKASLLTSLYAHFFIEHNKGHHKNVATKQDPSSARFGEPVYLFYFRTIIFSYISAWKIANNDARKKGNAVISLHNEMILLQGLQLVFVLFIFLLFGWNITLYYLIAALTGILLLETVNYIEHYGLSRKEISAGKYERAMPQHSWNSDHVIGRMILFELSRHSDHHYLASRKFQVLRHHEDAPQMPTGYPGMMILSLLPPAWFFVMHRQMKKYQLH
jgi:alkane 1-monooxygenase